MKNVKFFCGTGFPGVNHEEIIEYEDDTTEKEIEEDFKTWVWDRLNPYWKVIE